MTFTLRLALSAFALAALLLPSSAVGQNADGSRELSLGLQTPVVPLEAVPPLNCNVDSGDLVAWDLSNGATTSDHTLLISDLVAAGFTVRTVNIAVDGIPPCLRHLVITTQAFNACLTSVYPAPLVDLVRNSVRAGLGLFLLNEWGVFCGQGSAPIADALGALWNGNFGASQTFFAGIHFDPNNPATLFQGVSSWQQFAGSDYTTNVNVVVRTNANLPAMIAGRVERGCVVIAGDSNWIADNWISFQDNRNLAANALRFLTQCVRLEVAIDIKPGSDPNGLNPRSKGVIPVAILTTSLADGDSLDFDATDVDPLSLAFGPAGAGIAHAAGHVEDVDGDGDLDLVVHFRTQDTGIACGNTAATLTGITLGGQQFEGVDSVFTAGCK